MLYKSNYELLFSILQEKGIKKILYLDKDIYKLFKKRLESLTYINVNENAIIQLILNKAIAIFTMYMQDKDITSLYDLYNAIDSNLFKDFLNKDNKLFYLSMQKKLLGGDNEKKDS